MVSPFIPPIQYKFANMFAAGAQSAQDWALKQRQLGIEEKNVDSMIGLRDIEGKVMMELLPFRKDYLGAQTGLLREQVTDIRKRRPIDVAYKQALRENIEFQTRRGETMLPWEVKQAEAGLGLTHAQRDYVGTQNRSLMQRTQWAAEDRKLKNDILNQEHIAGKLFMEHDLSTREGIEGYYRGLLENGVSPMIALQYLALARNSIELARTQNPLWGLPAGVRNFIGPSEAEAVVAAQLPNTERRPPPPLNVNEHGLPVYETGASTSIGDFLRAKLRSLYNYHPVTDR